MKFILFTKLRTIVKDIRNKTNMMKAIDCEETTPGYELTFAKEQVKSLQKLVSELQDEIEAKDMFITNITKEKERHVADVKKYKRSNLNLKQQLEDERVIYLKEKEYYNKEMSENKLIRKKQLEEFKNLEEIVEQNKEIENLKVRITEINNTLQNTLEANYNLSVKFLRMKNSKYSLKAKLKREQTENAKTISHLVTNLEDIREEINHIISEKFNQVIPPSNKKYLQVVKQNTQLLYANLNYQLEMSKLYNLVERIKADKIKYETNLRLQYTRKRTSKARKNVDKMCETNLCNNVKRPSICSTTTDNFEQLHLYPEYEQSLKKSCMYKGHVKRIHSAPEFRVNNF